MKKQWLGRSILTGALSVLILGGCTRYDKEIATGPPPPLHNVYANPTYDHSRLANVLLLPIDNFMVNESVEFHRKELTQSILRNFGKFNYFNISYDRYYPEKAGRLLNLVTGEMDRIQLGEVGQTYRAQGVLQVMIDEFRAYPPMRLKVKAALIDTNTGERVWEFDHVFDADDSQVVNGMRIWWNTRVAGGDPRNRFEIGSLRPTVFANYVFYEMAQTYGKARVKNQKVVEVCPEDEEENWR